MRRIVALILTLAFAGPAARGMMPDRHGAHTKRAAMGPLATVRAATHFGSEGEAEFMAVGTLPDGTIAAFGNAWGPAFPASPAPVVLGNGEWHEVYEYPGGYKTSETGRRLDPSEDDPNISGMVVQYAPDMDSVRRVLKFDWGVATISTGAVATEGDLILAGCATGHFRARAETAETVHTRRPPAEDRKRYGPLYYEGVKMPGDVYVAKLSPDGENLKWACFFDAHRRPPARVWADKTGGVTFDLDLERKRISLDGKDLREYGDPSGSGRKRVLAVSPFDIPYDKYGGYHIAAFDGAFQNLCFSSYTPGGPSSSPSAGDGGTATLPGLNSPDRSYNEATRPLRSPCPGR